MNKHRSLTLAAVAATLLALGGCSSLDSRQTSTIAGAVVGGTVGHVLIGGPLATVGGAAAGAYIGNEAAKNKK